MDGAKSCSTVCLRLQNEKFTTSGHLVLCKIMNDVLRKNLFQRSTLLRLCKYSRKWQIQCDLRYMTQISKVQGCKNKARILQQWLSKRHLGCLHRCHSFTSYMYSCSPFCEGGVVLFSHIPRIIDLFFFGVLEKVGAQQALRIVNQQSTLNISMDLQP